MNLGIILFFTIFFLLTIILVISITSFFIKKKTKKFEPSISVIIPSYNEEKNIKNCIKHILNSNYDANKLEIICVDDGSTDNTINIIKDLIKKYSNIKLIKGKHHGKSKALNLGVERAKHDYVLTVDADTLLDKNFIKEIIAPFSDKKVGATNGIALIDKPKRIVEHFQTVEYYFNNLIRHSFSKVFNNGIWFFGAAACFKKDVLKKAGLFSSRVLTEDMDISLKIFEHGYDVLTVRKATYYTQVCHNLKTLFSQRMRWFYGGLQCSFKHRKLWKRKVFSIKYLFFNQIFWAFFSVIVIPTIIYQVNYWMPSGAREILAYLFRWFSLSGPIYVLYKIPEWGLSLINIFGVMAGILTFILINIAVIRFKGKLNLQKLLVAFFYFPYTLILNLILTTAIFRYTFSRKKHFKK